MYLKGTSNCSHGCFFLDEEGLQLHGDRQKLIVYSFWSFSPQLEPGVVMLHQISWHTVWCDFQYQSTGDKFEVINMDLGASFIIPPLVHDVVSIGHSHEKKKYICSATLALSRK